jgi:long-subunit fatty acid transport protein
LIPQIGYSSANYYGDQIESGNKSLSGITYGVGGDYFFNDRWSIRSGILFQTMGTKVTGFEDKLNYLTVPLNANWHFGSTRKWNLNFGPSLGFLTSAEANGVDNKDAVNSTQFGLNVGIGYKIEVNEKISILIDYQSLSGLNNVATDSNFTFKNTFGSFNVGGVFKL